MNLWVAWMAGVISFASPCCLPLYPSYLSYITGLTVQQLKNKGGEQGVRALTLTHTLAFILGFSAIFYSLGASAGLIGSLFTTHRDLLRQLSGILMMMMGLFTLGLIQPKWLLSSYKLNMTQKPAGYLGSFILGVGFAAGWSPCVGPMLASIIALAATRHEWWFWLITAYASGFALPFFVLSLFSGYTRMITKYSGIIMKSGGAILILTGLLLWTDRLFQLTLWLQRLVPAWI
ncbi:cytochrome c biogenesis CcdA family protein [Paenibacillus sp. JX-17]|uniref:Cytochrome c biogenesis CcdA family protein n=1 Tax=Paenibacillus lacisoli TaxID=3064525 RepID=A0ABT9CB08_9BACL|nr:cytochrome c biogenesis CcdA family protein [Paenibacillus sp. JX-17]MDO7905187.1 cytochrome c biogenesis CcdA family protein [Paenibacillus sp. JX-17]